MIAAVARGWLRMTETPPWVLDDVLALVLTGPPWQELQEQLDLLFPGQIGREARAAVCVRGRLAEDWLKAGAFAQYVILGVGLDSFAWRRPDLLRSLRVFEADHPASQAWKRDQVRDLALPLSDSHLFVPADFEADPLQDALARPDSTGPSRRCSPGPAGRPTSRRRQSSRRCARSHGPPPDLR